MGKVIDIREHKRRLAKKYGLEVETNEGYLLVPYKGTTSDGTMLFETDDLLIEWPEREKRGQS